MARKTFVEIISGAKLLIEGLKGRKSNFYPQEFQKLN